MRLHRFLLAVVMLIAGLGTIQKAEAQDVPLKLNFSSVTGAVIGFPGDGTFQFAPSNFPGKPKTYDFHITSQAGFDGQITPCTTNCTLVGLQGNLPGTFTIGAISGPDVNGLSTAAVSGTGTLTIFDGSVTFSATLNWLQIAQVGTIDGVNTTANVNLTGFNYAGTNPQLQQLAARPDGVVVVSFQFVQGTTLQQLAAGPGPNATSYSGSLIAPPLPMTAQCAAQTTGQVGTLYSSAIVTTGGQGPFTYSLATGFLPPGLNLDPASGQITGTPTAAGAFNFTVQVTDSTAGTAQTAVTPNCGITIVPPPVTAACVSAITGQVGISYLSYIVAAGGVSPYTFSLNSGTLPPGLTLDASSGAISGIPTQYGAFNFTVMVTDSNGNGAQTSVTPSCGITVSPAPLTLQCMATGTGQVGTTYSSALAAAGGVLPYTYSIISGSLPPGLDLNPTTGVIMGTPTQSGSFSFTAQVLDASGNASSNTTTVSCGITIAPQPVTLQCATTTGQVGVPYSSSLTASGGIAPYTYSIISGSLPNGLTLNATTGAITGTPTTAGPFSFTAQAVDSSGSSAGTMTSNCGITVAPAPLSLQCVASGAGQVGVAYSSSLTVSGGVPGYSYSIISGSLPPGLTLNATTGAITGSPTSAGTFNFTAQVMDSSGNSASNTATVNCGITVAPPTLAAQCVSATTATVGTPYSSAIQVSGGTVPYTFGLASGSLPAGLMLNSSTGVISGTPTSAGPFSFTVQVTDSTPGQAAVATTPGCGIAVNPPSMTALCVPTTTGTVGTAYSSAIQVNGGTTPYTFSLASGSLPAGLALNSSTGVISGMPTSAGPSSFTVQVTDSTPGQHAVATTPGCGISINPPSMSVQCVTATTGAVGSAYNSAIQVTGGTSPYTFALASGSLPPGLTLNSTTGTIMGTPTTAGPFSFTVKVTDSTPGQQATATTSNCGITINPPGMTAQCVSASIGTVGAAYSSAIQVSGGTTPYTFALASGALPAGLTLNPSTGVIMGTPTTAGPYSFTVQVTDSTPGQHAVTTTPNCGITINPPSMTAQCVSTTTGTVGTAYSSAIQVTGGTGPYTFSLASGSLPAGLTLNSSTGVISGTPTTAGPASFTVKVTDSTPGQHAVATTPGCGITVNPPSMTAQCVSLTTGMIGTTYNSSIAVTGGTGPYTFTLASGTLPAGLTLNASSGVITGMPTTAGPYSFTVKVTDSTPGVHATATTANCGITIVTAPSCNCGTISVYKGVPVTGVTLTGSGGVGGPYTFSNAQGLPAGLSISSTGAITGTPTAATGTYSYTVTLTDKSGNHITLSCKIAVNPPPPPICSVNDSALTMTYQSSLIGLLKFTVTTNLYSNFNVTVSDVGPNGTSTPTSLPTTTTYNPNVKSGGAMPTGEVIQLPSATKDAIQFKVARINSSKSAQLTVMATDAAGQTVSCDPVTTVLSSLNWQSGLSGVQTFSNLPQATSIISIDNGTPGLNDLLVLVNGVPFVETQMTNGQSITLSVAKAMKAGNNNVIQLIGIGFKANSSAQIYISQ